MIALLFFCCRNQSVMSGAVEQKLLNVPCSLRRVWTSPCWTCTRCALITTTPMWDFSVNRKDKSRSRVPSKITFSNGLMFCFSCAISSRPISWTSKWSLSKNWQTGWPTCGAWGLPRTAWPNTCLTNTLLAKRAAKWQNVNEAFVCVYLHLAFTVWSHQHDTAHEYLATSIYS